MKSFLFLLMPLLFLQPLISQSTNHLQQKSLNTPQGRWKYTTSGKGSNTLLFIHGASSSKNIWKNQYNLALDGYQKIFVDLLGYGESAQPDSGYSLTNWIEGLHSILEQELVQQVCIVAHSNGVILAKEYYRSYPDQVSHLLFLDGMLKPMIPEASFAWMKSTLERSDYSTFMNQQIQYMPVQGLTEEDAELLRGDARKVPKQVAMAEFELVSSPLTWKPLLIKCPTTIVHTNNPIWNQSYFDWLSEMSPNHKLLHWKDSGHFLQLQYPERLNELISQTILRGR